MMMPCNLRQESSGAWRESTYAYAIERIPRPIAARPHRSCSAGGPRDRRRAASSAEQPVCFCEVPGCSNLISQVEAV
jgi:hypothetical protein